MAKRISSVYGPAALVAMAAKGIPPSILGSLQNPGVETIGPTVVVISTVDPSAENEAKEFQGAIFDQIMKQQAPRAKALRGDIAEKIALAKSTSGDLEQEVSGTVKQIERFSTLSDDLRSQIEEQRAYLATLYKSAGTPEQSGDRAGIDFQIRKLQEQILGQTTLLGNLTQERYRLTHEIAEMRRLYEAQTKAVADAQTEQNMFAESQVSLPPAVIPAMTPAVTRWLSLLLVAFAISVLAGFGTVVLAHNIGVRRL